MEQQTNTTNNEPITVLGNPIQEEYISKHKKIDDSFKQYEKILNSIMKSPPPVKQSLKTKPETPLLEDGIIEDDPPAKNIIDTKDIDFNSSTTDLCSHSQITRDGSNVYCLSCGIELYEELSHEQEWRYFGSDTNKTNTQDSSRCQYYKTAEKGIEKELEKLGFAPDICVLANQLFMMITGVQIKKSELRKGLIFAVVHQAYMMKGQPKTTDELRKKFFGLTDRFMSQGLRFYKLRCPRTHLNQEEITAEHYIPKIMEKFNAKEEHISKVIELYKKVKESPELNRTNPSATAKALVYYYLRRKGCDVSIHTYQKIIELSASSIARLASEINRVLGSNVDLGIGSKK